jgi:rubrerythrin
MSSKGKKKKKRNRYCGADTMRRPQIDREHKCPVCKCCVFPRDDTYYICPVCDWEDNASDNRNPDEGGGANGVSLNEYRAEYRKLNKDVGIPIDRSIIPLMCPVCGEYEFSEEHDFDEIYSNGNVETCPVCGWEDDERQLRHPDEDGHNTHSLNNRKKWWLEEGRRMILDCKPLTS